MDNTALLQEILRKVDALTATLNEVRTAQAVIEARLDVQRDLLIALIPRTVVVDEQILETECSG